MAEAPGAETGVVALVASVRGDVTIERAGADTVERAEPGTGLRAGDAVQTAPGASAGIVVYSGAVRDLPLDGDRRWVAPAGTGTGMAWAPGLRTERVAAVFRSADLPSSILLPRWTRSEGLPFGLNWSREFPSLEHASLLVFDASAESAEPRLRLEGARGVVIPGGSLASGRIYRWQLLDAVGTEQASGHFEVIAPAALERVRGRLAALPDNAGEDAGVDWMALQQAAVLVDEELYLLAGRLLADAGARRPDDLVLQSWQRWVARMAASPAQLPNRKNAAQ